jgi:rhamnogalacturonyl hydrolase YesR
MRKSDQNQAAKHRHSPRAFGLFATLALGNLVTTATFAQSAATNPAAPAGFGARGQATYPIPYRPLTAEGITEVLNRVHAYLDTNTPARLVNRRTGEPIADLSRPNPDAMIERGAFQLISYEWGVTYAGMLLASETTGDARFKEYTARRFQFIADAIPFFRAQAGTNPPPAPSAIGGGRGAGGRGASFPFRSVIAPATLDDSGAMCAAMIKARRAGVGPDLLPQITNYIGFISRRQFRLADGTLARKRPQPETLWLDDLYMSVPALAQMGKLTGDRRYYDDACKQILQFASRMFVPEKKLWIHGWAADTDDHPAFHWARANGWAIMAMVELLEVLPEDHPQHTAVLNLLRSHIRGLAKCQAGSGLWHQLLDRDDTYLETSSSAMFVYGMARAINRGWVSPVTYGPVAELGWNAITTKVNAQGQVEGTCVGTGMAFDYAFYYNRPTSVLAAHGYGPVLLAGAELIKLVKNETFVNNDGAIQYAPKPANP